MITANGDIVDNSSLMNLDESWNIPVYSYYYQYDDELEPQDLSEIDLEHGVNFDYNNSELPPLFKSNFEKVLIG